jgi:hypothetical protein
MHNKKLTASRKSSTEVVVEGDEPGQRAFFGICLSRNLLFKIFFFIMKMDIVMNIKDYVPQTTLPAADAFTIRFDNAEQSESLYSTLQEIINEINNQELNASRPLPCTTTPATSDQGVLASKSSTPPLCTAPAAIAPTGIAINTGTWTEGRVQTTLESSIDPGLFR